MADELVPEGTPEAPPKVAEERTLQTLGVTPSYVLQRNAMSRGRHDLSATAQKLTAMAMSLLPFDLSSLTASFTFAEFCTALGFAKESRFAIQLFELIVSYMSLSDKAGNQWSSERTTPELRKMFGIPDGTYLQVRDFRKYVIEKPVEEINAANIGVEITTVGIKEGRNLKAIQFDCKKVPRTTAKRGRRKARRTRLYWRCQSLHPEWRVSLKRKSTRA